VGRVRRVTDLLEASVWQTLHDLVDLVLPLGCAGCDGAYAPSGVCAACEPVLSRSPVQVRPTPAPAGLPVCLALGDYEGPLREMIIGYKERGRRHLARPLGDGLAAVVRAAGRLDRDVPGSLVLVPVPATAAAIRARHGDHMRALGRRVAGQLRTYGWRVVVAAPVRARPRADSAHLDRIARARSAQQAFLGLPQRLQALREMAERGARVVLLDDVMTTGSTLSALALCLSRGGVAVDAAAVLAATQLRQAGAAVPAKISSEGFA
jgi:predicted amidophosphoribosyltransferase